MSFKLISDHFSVTRNTNHFVIVKTLKSPRVGDELWVLLSINDDKKYARSTAQNIINTLDETYFDHLELGSYERLEIALKEVNVMIDHLREKRGSGRRELCHCSICRARAQLNPNRRRRSVFNSQE
ncbi:hypothetical protein IPJ72_06430 [Candidatus Peregrinibacteria bacterium]|nr:MAG: hypothetical protein IPJ72_06430 [Candidatus Peregrinibacteria bacterium]